MKNIIIKAFAAIVLLISSISCTTSDAEKDAGYRSTFISSGDVSAWAKGKKVKEFNSKTDQIVYSTDKANFMISNTDNSVNYTLSLSGTFITGYKVNVSCEAAGISSLGSKSYEMTVLQTDESSKTYWLWDSSTSTGFIVCFTL